MSNRVWGFTLLVAAVVVIAVIGNNRASAADGSVRFLTAGPVALGDGHWSYMRVFLPAVQTTPIHFLGEGGRLLTTVQVTPPPESVGPFFEASFTVRFDGPGAQRFGMLSITDGTSNTIFSGQANGIIAVLIGVRQRGGMGTMQLFNAVGESAGILPYIEQDNLFRVPVK
jgi:hypothetical protein